MDIVSSQSSQEEQFFSNLSSNFGGLLTFNLETLDFLPSSPHFDPDSPVTPPSSSPCAYSLTTTATTGIPFDQFQQSSAKCCCEQTSLQELEWPNEVMSWLQLYVEEVVQSVEPTNDDPFSELNLPSPALSIQSSMDSYFQELLLSPSPEEKNITIKWVTQNERKPSQNVKFKQTSNPPRPRNAFFIFRNENQPSLQKKFPNLTMTELSVKLGDLWKNASAETKERYRIKAEEERARHKRIYPFFKYRADLGSCPKSRKKK